MKDFIKILIYILRNRDLVLSILTLINRIKRDKKDEVQK